MITTSSLDRFIESLKPYLHDFLTSKGYDTSRNIHCINPNHEDRTPSMTVGDEKYYNRVRCWSCGFSGDIFDVKSALDGTPHTGEPGWLSQTAGPLAEQFGIPMPGTPSPEDEFRYQFYRVMERVGGLIETNLDKMTPLAKEALEKRRWSQENIQELLIGELPFNKISDNVPQKDLDKFGLMRPDVFREGCPIFPTRDEKGRLVRFYSRNIHYSKEAEGINARKFNSTTTSSLLVDIWQGTNKLYLIEKIPRDCTQILLVEGHPDAVSIWETGLIPVVGILGTSGLRDSSLRSLIARGIQEIIIGLDPDPSGKKALETILERDLIKKGYIKTSVLTFPPGYDPDDYVREYGKIGFQKLLSVAKISSFQYLLQEAPKDLPPVELVEKLIPYIAASKSEIRREVMARTLSEYIGQVISSGTILTDIRRKDEAILSKISDQKRILLDIAQVEARKNLDNAPAILRETVIRMEQIEDGYGGIEEAKSGCLMALSTIKEEGEIGLPGGHHLNPSGLGNLSDLLEGGAWYSDRLIVVGAVPNMGKSSWIDQFIWESISNPENNSMAFLLTLDDPIRVRFHRMGSIAANSLDFEQNMMANPNHFAMLGKDWIWKLRETAFSKLTQAIAQDKLIIQGKDSGRTIAYAREKIRQIRRRDPSKNIILAIDNIHNCQDNSSGDRGTRVSQIIQEAKTIAEEFRSLTLVSAEYRKGDRTRPGTDEDLAEHRAMSYEPHLTIHLFSDINEEARAANTEPTLVHSYKNKLLPKVIGFIGKNKITERKGKLGWKFYPAAGIFRKIDSSELQWTPPGRKYSRNT